MPTRRSRQPASEAAALDPGYLLDLVLPLAGSYAGRVVVVTGASSGIGQHIAATFARLGAVVGLIARRRELLQELAATIRAAGGTAIVAAADVTDRKAARAAIAKVKRACGRIDVLVNNAGILIPSPVAKLRPGDFESMLQVNVFGALHLMQSVLPIMDAQGQGTIVNIASLGGRRGVTPLGGYCATKFALVGLTEALRTEVEQSKIHVALVLPGVVDTPMVQGVSPEVLSAWPQALNMPPEWVTAAVLLATRFHLREISVPPGATTLELLGALAPRVSDALIRWTQVASRWLSGGG